MLFKRKNDDTFLKMFEDENSFLGEDLTIFDFIKGFGKMPTKLKIVWIVRMLAWAALIGVGIYGFVLKASKKW